MEARLHRRDLLFGAAAAAAGCVPRPARGADDDLRAAAERALRRAVRFFREEVSVQGGYLWRYSEDLARREGEAKATAAQAWVQPPGTPSVGMVYLEAFAATRDPYYLDAARETARALVNGQLRSGGWDYRIEFDPRERRQIAYRAGPAAPGDAPRGRNVTTLDDDTTQAALRCLLRVDRALGSADREIRAAVEYALAALARAQYPNGAWPQQFESPPDPQQFPVRKAAYPESWPRTWPGADYRSYYTLNDNNVERMIETLLEAEQTFGRGEAAGSPRAMVKKAGEFLLLAQMPDPQPAWAQQYDREMHPAWARKFEPPSVTGGESQGVLRTLLRLYRETGERQYLEPVPRALEYLRRSRLPGGRLARFYELKTNRPLYFTKEYALTYEDDDLPTHYSFQVADSTGRLAREYEQLRERPAGSPPAGGPSAPRRPAPPRLTEELAARARAAVAALDERGRWVEAGRLRSYGPEDPTRRVIVTETFIRNVAALSRYLAAVKRTA